MDRQRVTIKMAYMGQFYKKVGSNMLLEDRLVQLSVGEDKEKIYNQWSVLKIDVEKKLSTEPVK